MIDILNLHLGYMDRTLGWVGLTDFLKDAREGLPKLHGLRRDLSVCGVIDTGRALVGILQKGLGLGVPSIDPGVTTQYGTD